MYKVGDLVMYLPFSCGMGGWIMFEGIGIIVGIDNFNERGKLEYKVKWVKNYEESFVAGDFLILLEEVCK